MKIKFIAYWNTDRNIYNFINDIWNIDGKYSEFLTHGNDYTHLVVLNKCDRRYINTSKDKTYGIVIEPFWSPNFDKNIPQYCNKVYSYQPHMFIGYNNIHLRPLIGTHRLYDCEYHGELIFKENTTSQILNTKFEKTKKLSIIVNHHHDAITHKQKYSESLYLERDNLVKKLLNSDIDFDMYGQDWNIADSRYKGFLSNKIDGIKDYEYTISLENSRISGNITEKFIDALLCDTISIYNGHPDINLYYPNSCEFLEYDGNEIENIKRIISSDKTYKDYNFEQCKNLYLNEYNPIKIIYDDINGQIR